jgi:SAM-dependent methyltransferase
MRSTELAGSPPRLPPAMLRYRVSETLDPNEFLNVGKGCARLLEEHSAQMGSDLAQAHRVLDFGCGCGRTLRWMLKDFPAVDFHGADVDAEAIQWCKLNLPGAHFVRSQPEPPLPYPDLHFDIIYCLSVFTHLDEAPQDRWLAELARLLTPGGLLILTVHGLRASKVLDLQGLARLESTGFVHRRSRKLEGIVPDWYHTTWHSERYIVDRLSAQFEVVRYRDTAGGQQAFVMARRRLPYRF